MLDRDSKFDPNSDPNRPFGYDGRRLTAGDSPLGALIGLLVILALCFLAFYFFGAA
jgi:hypothetical protein